MIDLKLKPKPVVKLGDLYTAQPYPLKALPFRGKVLVEQDELIVLKRNACGIQLPDANCVKSSKSDHRV
jgi:hypothetical protein